MSVHGRSFFQYLNEDDDKWYPIPTSDLVSVDYVDKVYAPASVELVISNKRMNEVLGTDIDASSGTYTVEGEVANPTFRRYQTVRLFNLPRALELESITHNGASPAVFSKDAHGLTNGDFIHLVNEESGVILDAIYEVTNVTTDTFRLDGVGTGSASQTYATAVAGDGVSLAMVVNEDEDVTTGATTISVDTVTGGGTPDTQVEVGSYIKIDNEIMQITGTAATTISVTRARLGTTAATHSDDASVYHQRSAYIAMRTDKMMYCYFYGKIDSVDVSYSDAVGKTIHLQASDYLLTLGTEPITKAIQDSSSACDDFSTTRLVQADPEEATDQGKFRDALYDNAKYSDTLKAILSDWAFGKSLYTDNTYDGTNSIGEAKFQESAFSFETGDISRKKKFGGNDTTALKAMVNIAMTERHSNTGLEFPRTGVSAAEVSYGSATSEVNTGDDQDVLIKASSHGYVNGNMVNVSGDNLDGVDADDYIHDGSYIVHSVNTNNFKIKGLDGNTITSTADASTARRVNIKAEPSGGQGYDFYLDTGLYGTTNGEAFAGHSQDTHRPHINYFMRGSEPVDPGATGLTVYYPTSENQSESDTDWNMTKVFMQPDFDHGLFDDDLYTQVALSAVDDNGQVKNANDLGHKMEMFKVNSISNEDYTSDRTLAYYKQQASGEECGAGVFHWHRGDDVRTYKWQSTDTNTYDELYEDNVTFFAGGAASSNTNKAARESMSHSSDGTFGVIEHNKGGFLNGKTTSGMAGFSPLPAGGRSITDPPNTTANDGNTHADHPKMKALVTLTGTMEPEHFGATALTGANLIKDVYNCEVEGLLGTEVTASQATVSGDIKVNATGHGLETGTLIRITDINDDSDAGTTTAGVKINTAPTRTNGVNADTTDTGSYYRVEYEDANYFWLTLPQKHRTNIDATSDRLAFSTTTAGGTFKYKPVFNVFKEVCRVQWQSGFDWTTGEDLTVLRTSLTTKGAQSLLVSDVVKNDRPYKGVQVNALLAPPQHMPGADHHGVIANHNYINTSPADNHPRDFYDSGGSQSYFGYATVAQSLEADFPDDDCTANVDRFGAGVADDVPVLFRYGDYISETRLLYGDDSGITGVVGRDRSSGAGGAAKSSNDVFKNVNCKIIERFKDKRSISKTYPLKYNATTSADDWDSVREAAAGILSRTIIPAKRTTFNIFGYPTIKLVGQGQSGTSGNTLVPAQHPVSFGGRAGMLVEKLDAADGAGGNMTATSLATAIATSSGNITAPLDDGTNWTVGTYYRFFIYLRAGSSIRVVHPAAGVTGNMIITGLKYSERAGHTRTTISTTGYDEAFINQMHAPLGQLIKSIRASSSNVQPTVKTSLQILALHNETYDQATGFFVKGALS